MWPATGDLVPSRRWAYAWYVPLDGAKCRRVILSRLKERV